VLIMRFEPAVSKKALKRMRQTMRCWAVHRRTGRELDEIAAHLNPVIRGWINYYGAFGRSELNYSFMHLNSVLANWAKNKFKRMKRSWKRAYFWLCGVAKREPNLFAHWELLKIVPTAER